MDGAKYHVSEILSKLGVSSREEAARWAPSERPWWATAAAPLGWAWQKANVSWLATAVAGVGLLVWGLLRTEGGADSNDGTSLQAAYPTARIEPDETPIYDNEHHEIAMVSLSERLSVDCSHETPGLRVERREAISANAIFRIQTMAPFVREGSGGLRSSIVGTAETFTVGGSSSDNILSLSSSLLANLDGEADHLIVIINYIDAEGRFYHANESISAADLKC